VLDSWMTPTTENYGGPEGRAMHQYLSDSIYATINHIYVTIDDNYATMDNRNFVY